MKLMGTSSSFSLGRWVVKKRICVIIASIEMTFAVIFLWHLFGGLEGNRQICFHNYFQDFNKRLSSVYL